MDSLEKLKTLIFEAENCNPQVAERKLNYIVEFIRKEFDDEIYGKPSLEEAIDEINSIKHKLKNKSNGIREADNSRHQAIIHLRSVLSDIEK